MVPGGFPWFPVICNGLRWFRSNLRWFVALRWFRYGFALVSFFSTVLVSSSQTARPMAKVRNTSSHLSIKLTSRAQGPGPKGLGPEPLGPPWTTYILTFVILFIFLGRRVGRSNPNHFSKNNTFLSTDRPRFRFFLLDRHDHISFLFRSTELGGAVVALDHRGGFK